MNTNLEPLTRRRSIQKLSFLESLLEKLSPAERVVWWVLIAIFCVASYAAFASVNAHALVVIPDRGGSLTEGIVGSPRFINPLLAISDADRDLTTLLYSGLLRAAPDGSFIPDLAERYEVSEDALSYTFVIRDSAVFHDGTPVTSDDIVFTIERAKDPAVKSPKRPNWDGVLVEKIDEKTVRFQLRQPYAPFLENATLGILPKHLWGSMSAEEFALSSLNNEPIGSGAFRVRSYKRDKSGAPSAITLVPFERFTLGAPYLSELRLRFYGNEESLINAWQSGNIESMSSVSFHRIEELKQGGAELLRVSLPRIFAIFVNQTQAPLFTHAEVRQALDLALDKEAIVADVLKGYGTPIGSPVPPGIAGYTPLPPQSADLEAAAALLTKSGWVQSEVDFVWEKTTKKGQPPERLTLSLATSNAPELKAAAEIVKRQWEAFGAGVTLQFFETGDLQQNIIRPRRFDALLFGEIIGRDLDFYAFWHSSQRNDPGLNVALYTSSSADTLLERGRTTLERVARLKIYQEFEQEVVDDTGAFFIYTPDFLYLIPEELEGIHLGLITTPADRFINTHEWHTKTNKVWDIFAR